jgi:hypothetical protein
MIEKFIIIKLVIPASISNLYSLFLSLLFYTKKKIFFYNNKMALKFIDTINKLDFTYEERTSLFSYFYKNSTETDKVILYLDNCRDDNEKFYFLKKTFLSGMF